MLPHNIEKILLKDKLTNISILGFFSKREPVTILRHNGSFMAKGISDEPWWYFALKNPKDFEWFIKQTKQDDRYLAAIDDDLLDQVKNQFTCRWILSAQRFYLTDEIQIPKPELKLVKLTPDDAEHIYNNSNYKQYTSVAYIREQIKNGLNSAYREGSLLAGWVLTHDDGALGMLHVLDDYRRKGIAKAVVVDIINKVRNQGLIPYTYVEPENCPSINLVNNLGFVSHRIVHWVNINR